MERKKSWLKGGGAGKRVSAAMSIDFGALMRAKNSGDMEAIIGRAMDDATDEEINDIMSAFVGKPVTAARRNPPPLPRYRSSSYLLEHMQTSESERFDDADAVVAEFDKVAYKESDFEDNLARALLFWGLMSPELGRDWYDATFGKKSLVLLDCLKAVEMLTSEVGVEWYAERFKSEELREALNEAGLMKGCTREWIAEHFPRVEVMVSCLRDAGLLTADPGLEWYIDKIGKRHEPELLLSVLKETGLAKDLDLETCVKHLYGLPTLYEALEACGQLRPEHDRDWYVDHFGKRWHNEEDKDHAYFSMAMQAAGLLKVVDDPGSDEARDVREWFAKVLEHNPMDLYRCLKACGLVTADPGADWYVDHVKRCEPFVACLRDAGLLTPDRGEEWYRKAMQGVGFHETGSFFRDSSCGRGFPIYGALTWKDWLDMALFEAGLRDGIPEGTVRWYAASLKGEALLDAITEAGLLNEVGLAWLCARFGRSSKLTVKAMRASGMWDNKYKDVVMRYLDGEALEEYMQDKGLDEYDLEDATRNCTSSYWVRGTDGGDGGRDY
jgi:hypothetical protein